MKESYDLVVIGGGPGGYVAAIRASQLGLKTALIERESLGGICLNWGCMPTKSLLRSADVLRLIQRSQEFGITSGEASCDIQAIVARSRSVSAQLESGVAMLLRKNKVTVIHGSAQLLGDGKVTVKNNATDNKAEDQAQILHAKDIILATGARAKSIPDMPVDGEYIWSYREALVPKEIPKRMIILGAGAIGIEFACFYRAMGAEVTIIEMSDTILPQSDHEVITAVTKSLKNDGITILTGHKVVHHTIQSPHIQVELIKHQNGDSEKQIVLEADVVLQAIGINANIENIGLENTQVTLDKGHIVTDSFCKTQEANVYAIGDVAGPPWLAHKASYEGVLCAEKIVGKQVEPLQINRVPACIYSHPQVASIGFTEKDVKALNIPMKIGVFPFAANGKSLAMGGKEGFVKVIFNENSGELLGAHMVGEEVTEMLNGYVIAQKLETTEEDLIGTIFSHPTMSEAMHEAVLSAYNRAIHQ